MQREFTGRDMLLVLIVGFGIVVAVNFYMAGQASKSFSGVVVQNSYQASQKFNEWLDEAERGQELGWKANLTRSDDGYLDIETSGVPSGALIEAELRRPVGERQSIVLSFSQLDESRFRSDLGLEEGRWIARIRISGGDDSWAFESEIK